MSDFVPLGDALAAVGKELGMPEPKVVSRVETVWAEVVGPTLASHSEVRSLRDGVCSVTVDSASWATQLRYLHDDLVRRLCEVLGTGSVTTIRTAVRPPAGAG
jgi:predicted nucleic acid-binding Zn ribbon protein